MAAGLCGAAATPALTGPGEAVVAGGWGNPRDDVVPDLPAMRRRAFERLQSEQPLDAPGSAYLLDRLRNWNGRVLSCDANTCCRLGILP